MYMFIVLAACGELPVSNNSLLEVLETQCHEGYVPMDPGSTVFSVVVEFNNGWEHAAEWEEGDALWIAGCGEKEVRILLVP